MVQVGVMIKTLGFFSALKGPLSEVNCPSPGISAAPPHSKGLRMLASNSSFVAGVRPAYSGL